MEIGVCQKKVARWRRGAVGPARPPIPRSQFARVVKGVDLRSTAGNCAWVRTPLLTYPQNNTFAITSVRVMSRSHVQPTLYCVRVVHVLYCARIVHAILYALYCTRCIVRVLCALYSVLYAYCTRIVRAHCTRIVRVLYALVLYAIVRALLYAIACALLYAFCTRLLYAYCTCFVSALLYM